MTHPLEHKMNRLQSKLKGRTKPNGDPKPGYEQNVAQIRAEMQIISSRIELALRSETDNAD